MTQAERRRYLIATLFKEQPQYSKAEIPPSEQEQKALLRALFNIRMPKPASDEFLSVQNAYLQEEARQKGITSLADLQPIVPGLSGYPCSFISSSQAQRSCTPAKVWMALSMHP